jgi:hypothetical protein
LSDKAARHANQGWKIALRGVLGMWRISRVCSRVVPEKLEGVYAQAAAPPGVESAPEFDPRR